LKLNYETFFFKLFTEKKMSLNKVVEKLSLKQDEALGKIQLETSGVSGMHN
jgi:hypothetical protein